MWKEKATAILVVNETLRCDAATRMMATGESRNDI